MGRPATADAAIIDRQADVPTAPALRVVSTPADEVDVVCRLTLATFLAAQQDSVPTEALQSVLGAHTPGRDLTPTAVTRPASWHALHDRLLAVTILDPACGEGHFLAGMLKVFDQLLEFVECHTGRSTDRLRRHRHIVQHVLYGVDVQLVPLERARVRLHTTTGGDASAERPTVNLACLDTLLTAGDDAWHAAFPAVGGRGFDLIVGNPPYLRHEAIADPTATRNPHKYKRAMLIQTYRRWPEYFGWNEETQRATRPLDGRSDLCVPFVFVACSLLARRGALGLILPAAVFQARYGRILRAFLADDGWESWAGLTPGRGSGVQARVNTALLFASRIAPTSSHTPGLTELELTGMQPDEAWGEYRAVGCLSVRAAVSLLSGLPGITSLSTLCRLRYPIKTGLNSFFYPSAETRAQFGIEPEFCRPVVKSPRDILSIVVSAAQCSTVAFVCTLDKWALAEQGYTGALSYIDWAGRQSTADGTPWPDVRSLLGRRPWYRLPLPEPAKLICPRFFDQRFFFAVPQTGLVEDQTFYGLLPATAEAAELTVLAATLNSSFTALALESGGRTGLGDGVRQYALSDLATLPVLSPAILDRTGASEAREAFGRLASRPILPIAAEIAQEDRRTLDEVIARAAGVSPAGLRSIQQLLLTSVERRLDRARQARSSRSALAE